ncbi:putative thymidylate synthase [Methanothermobacter sp. MT-2]|nr:putative thymidylate synthase [Methanothermobacter sp. MT-2]
MSTSRRSKIPNPIDFKPIKDKLNLMAVFRSQSFDTKAYGNFIALAILLHRMCQAAGYKPGAIVSTANKVTFDGHKNDLYKHLRANIVGHITHQQALDI